MPTGITKRLSLAINTLLHGVGSSQRQREVPSITPEEVAEARTFFPMDKFFIFGHARSGTTLLTRLMRVHPAVHCNYQGHFFTRAPLLEGLVQDDEIGSWLSRRSNRWNQGRDLSTLVLRAAADFIMERDARKAGKWAPGNLVGDKSPNSLLDGEAVRKLVKVYPEARLIFIVRDGRDAAVSHRFQAFIDRQQHLSPEDQRIRQGFSEDPAPFLSGQRSIFTEKGLRQAAEGWRHNVIDTDQVAQQLLGERYSHLRYEDLLEHPWEQMCRLWSFLGADTSAPDLQDALNTELGQNPDADWQQHKASEIAGTLTKGQRGTWRELFTPRDRQIFKQAAGDTLVAWGYEKDLDW
jgi:Sulfotransferase family